jgi:hypothetical protein
LSLSSPEILGLVGNYEVLYLLSALFSGKAVDVFLFAG